MNPQQVEEAKKKARSFVEAYHSDLDAKKKSELENRYREKSTLTFHNEQLCGPNQISERLMELPDSVRQISTFDCQLSQPAGAMLVLVYGMLLRPDRVHSSMFSQMLYLMPTEDGFYVSNEVFQVIHEY